MARIVRDSSKLQPQQEGCSRCKARNRAKVLQKHMHVAHKGARKPD
jgi:hypothetical protein